MSLRRISRKKALQQAKSFVPPKPSPDSADALLDVHQIATLMRVSPRMVRKLAKEDRDFSKTIYLGANVRWRVRDYNAYIERRRQAGAA